MKYCIILWSILFGRPRVVATINEISIPNPHEADQDVKRTQPADDSHRLTASLPTPEHATSDIEEGEHRGLRGRKQTTTGHHDIFDIFDVFDRSTSNGHNCTYNNGYRCDMQLCPWPPPSCDDGNLCTSDDYFCRKAGRQWVCLNPPKQCASGQRCDVNDGVCKVVDTACRSAKPLCDDGDLCTSDSASCNEATGMWQCANTPKQCGTNKSCDKTDGVCKSMSDDQRITCVAVARGDSFDGASAERKWAEFRRRYPSRPFCLLALIGVYGVHVPDNFVSDNNTIAEYDIPDDNGDVKYATLWDMKCRLDDHTSADGAWVALFIQDEAVEGAISASRDVFINNLKAKNIQVKRVYSSNLDWIEPFTKSLVPGT